MSNRYYKDYFMALLSRAGFKLVKEEEKKDDIVGGEEGEKEEEIIKVSNIMGSEKELIERYKSIPEISIYKKGILEKRQKQMQTNNEENNMLEKYFFSQIINTDITVTSLKDQTTLFYEVWMENTKKKKLLHEYYYQKDFEENMKKELLDICCTEKMENIAEKIKIVKNIEKIIGWKHGDLEKVINPPTIEKAYEYLNKNHNHIHAVFKLIDQSKKKDEEIKNKLLYSLKFINKLFKDFNGYSLTCHTIDKSNKKASSYKMTNSLPDYDYKYIHNIENNKKIIEEIKEEMEIPGMKPLEDYFSK